MKRKVGCFLLKMELHESSRTRRQNLDNVVGRSVRGGCEDHMRPSLCLFDDGSQGVVLE